MVTIVIAQWRNIIPVLNCRAVKPSCHRAAVPLCHCIVPSCHRDAVLLCHYVITKLTSCRDNLPPRYLAAVYRAIALCRRGIVMLCCYVILLIPNCRATVLI